MMNQKEFNQNLRKFDELENRGSYYPMFLNMIKKGFETEAFLFILSTWNFATFRYAMKDFDLNNFKRVVKSLAPLFEKLDNETFETINFGEFESEIKEIYDSLSKIKGIQYTGASKLMHLKNPRVFIMWDGYIRKAYGFKKRDSEDYFNFLKKMQQEFRGIKKEKDQTLAKCIDEYNYVKYTLPALEKNRKKDKKNKDH